MEIRIAAQGMFLTPSVEGARQKLLQELFSYQAVVTTQNRITATRYQVSLDQQTQNTEDATYKCVALS